MSETAGSKERSGKLARIAIAALEEKKASDIRVIDISEVSVLADYFIIFGDVIVHIFNQENRLLYDLERIWRDGKQVNPEEL